MENQIAILYCGTQGLLSGISRNLVQKFEIEFIEVLEKQHKDVLESLRNGNIGESETSVLRAVALKISSNYSV